MAGTVTHVEYSGRAPLVAGHSSVVVFRQAARERTHAFGVSPTIVFYIQLLGTLKSLDKNIR